MAKKKEDLNGFEFPRGPRRALAMEVNDGDTFRALVDLGFNTSARVRVRIEGLDTAEFKSRSNKKADVERAKAARQALVDLLTMSVSPWPLLIDAKKIEADPETFGRWVAKVTVKKNGKDVDVATEMKRLGH